MKYVLITLVLCLGLVACKKKKTVDQPAVDEKIIQDFIKARGLDAIATGSGLYYVVKSQGTGIRPNINSNVTVKYKGYLADETVFDQSTNTGAAFNLSGVIKGWQEGIPLFNRGGRGILLIPSALGYGSKAMGKIPANSVLIFDIDLLDVQ